MIKQSKNNWQVENMLVDKVNEMAHEIQVKYGLDEIQACQALSISLAKGLLRDDILRVVESVVKHVL